MIEVNANGVKNKVKPIYIPEYVEGGKVDLLISEVPWVSVESRRRECFMSDVPREYQYKPNGSVYQSVEFHPIVREVMEKINTDFDYGQNVCFLNFYLDQWQGIEWHADDHVMIDHSKPIVVVSYGQAREIWWKEFGFKGDIPDDQKQLLGDGSMFVMPAGMQGSHFHKIPKGSREMKPRVSLTFRSVK